MIVSMSMFRVQSIESLMSLYGKGGMLHPVLAHFVKAIKVLTFEINVITM
jgi:hypothetical protein